MNKRGDVYLAPESTRVGSQSGNYFRSVRFELFIVRFTLILRVNFILHTCLIGQRLYHDTRSSIFCHIKQCGNLMSLSSLMSDCFFCVQVIGRVKADPDYLPRKFVGNI